MGHPAGNCTHAVDTGAAGGGLRPSRNLAALDGRPTIDDRRPTTIRRWSVVGGRWSVVGGAVGDPGAHRLDTYLRDPLSGAAKLGRFGTPCPDDPRGG